MTENTESIKDKLRISSSNVGMLIFKIIVLALFVGFLWFIRPIIHPIIYSTVYSPFGLIFFGGSIIVGTILYFLPPFEKNFMESAGAKVMILGVIMGFLLVLGIVVGTVGGVYEEMHKAEVAMDNVEIIDEPHEMNPENPRITPRSVSDTQASATMSYPQHRLGESDIARTEDGDLAWSQPIVPDQLRNQFEGNQIGMVHSDMTAMENRDIVPYDEYEYTYGQNMRLNRNVEWQMKKEDGGFLSQYNDDPYEIIYEGEAYMVYPKETHSWERSGIIPYTVPEWDGVALVHQDGTIEHLSPEEAQERPELDGQRLYPLSLTEEYAESIIYRNGYWNQAPVVGTYDNVSEPANVPSDTGNDQPFVVDLEGETMSYVYSMEAAGSGEGLNEMWFFDSETGDMTMYESGDENIFGPDRAIGIAQGTDTQTEWGPDGDAMAVEPIPMVVDNTLYWHIKVVTSDKTDVVRNIFVNAESEGSSMDEDEALEDTIVMESTQDVQDFIAGDIEEDDLETGDDVSIEDPDEDSDESVEYYIVINDEFGQEVDRIPIEQGQETTIETVLEEEEE